jgi:hypothetical protein
MRHLARSVRPNSIVFAALISFFIVGSQSNAQTESDPHRSACATAHCRKIKSYVKAHYCGESPYGNGPDDGCLIKLPKKPRAGIKAIADFDCEWSESKQVTECQQQGRPTEIVHDVLVRELRKLGLPAKASGQIYFSVWEPPQAIWSVAEAYYSRLVGSDLELCQVIAIIDLNSQPIVLRRVPFKKTNADVPGVTLWSTVDLADADGDGQVDIILQGDAYEDHWLEVVSVERGSPKTVFSGLGYYL